MVNRSGCNGHRLGFVLRRGWATPENPVRVGFPLPWLARVSRSSACRIGLSQSCRLHSRAIHAAMVPMAILPGQQRIIHHEEDRR